MLAMCRSSMFKTGLVFAVLAGGFASLVSAQNLITNPHFDTGLDGWEQFLNHASWDGTKDADGSATSGSVHAFVDDPSVNGITIPLGQCVPLTPGVTYHLRAQILVPTGQVAAGVASLLMIPYPTGD